MGSQNVQQLKRRLGPTCPVRFVVTHYNGLSARFRYLKFDNQICAPVPLPRLVSLCETPPAVEIVVFPGAFVEQLRHRLELPEGALELVGGWVRWIEAPGGHLPVYLLRALGPDPFPTSGTVSWLELPECFSLTPLERQLLRGAYDYYLT